MPDETLCATPTQACEKRRATVNSPLTGLLMKVDVVPNHTVRSLVREWQEAHDCRAPVA
jgi:hypothetical protein